MSNLMSLIANSNRDPRRRPKPYTPMDFNPTIERPKQSARAIVGTLAAALRVKKVTRVKARKHG